MGSRLDVLGSRTWRHRLRDHAVESP